MNFKTTLMATLAIAAITQSGIANAATVIGTYSMDATASLSSGQGMAYNGSSWYYGAGSSWQRYNNSAWQTSSAPTDISDGSAGTFLADTSASGSLSLDLGFNNTYVVNGSGSVPGWA